MLTLNECNLLLVVLKDSISSHNLVLNSLLDIKVSSDTLVSLDIIAEVAEHFNPPILGVFTETLPFQNVFFVLCREGHICWHCCHFKVC